MENMDELKHEFLDFAYDFYCRYVADFEKSADVEEYLLLPLSYIEFAREETQLFKLLFISDMDLEMAEAKDFYKEIDNEKRGRGSSRMTIGVEPRRAEVIFLDLFLYTTWDRSPDGGEKNVAGHARKDMPNVLSACGAGTAGKEPDMKTNQYLIDFYSHYDEGQQALAKAWHG